MRPKSFVIICVTYVYIIDIPTMGSHGGSHGWRGGGGGGGVGGGWLE